MLGPLEKRSTHIPLKDTFTGSNPVRATKLSTEVRYIVVSGFFLRLHRAFLKSQKLDSVYKLPFLYIIMIQP